METITPGLIIPPFQSDSFGPFAVANLLSLWAKVRIHLAGRSVPGFEPFENELDQKLLDALNMSREEFVDHISKHRPTYHAFEAWLRDHPKVKACFIPGTGTAAGPIGEFNSAIFSRTFSDAETENAHREAYGLPVQVCRNLTKSKVETLEAATALHKLLAGIEAEHYVPAGDGPAGSTFGD